MNIKKHRTQKGFTLIEVLVVIGIIAVLAAIVIVAINPGRQFAEARNTQRTSNVQSILNAVGQNMADNKGVFTCGLQALPTSLTDIASSAFDLRTCIVPTYIAEIPIDPSTGIAWNGTLYDTKYTILQEASTTRVTVCAPGGVEAAIAGSASICLTR